MKKLLFLLPLFIVTLYAQNIQNNDEKPGIFSKLPYDIQIGKKLPKIVASKMIKTKIQYQVTGKFALTFSDIKDQIVDSVIFAYGDYDMPLLVPKVWRRAGIEFCYDNSDGTPYKFMRKLVVENGGKKIDAVRDQTSITLSFTVDDNKRYEMIFFTFRAPNDHGKGLAYITVSKPEEISDDEYY